jgi:uncharacterized membrane protein YdbT with pleckstrin-like domain
MVAHSFTEDQLLPGETLIASAHQHFLVLARPILLNAISAGILIGLATAFQHYWFMFFYLFPLAFLIWEWLVWRRREYIVTNKRVVKQEGVLNLNSFDAPLDKINNVFHEQSLTGRIFRYGTVGLETASEQGTSVFPFLPRPVEFKNCIVRAREEYRFNPDSYHQHTRGDVIRLLEELAALRDKNVISPEEFEDKKKSLMRQL